VDAGLKIVARSHDTATPSAKLHVLRGAQAGTTPAFGSPAVIALSRRRPEALRPAVSRGLPLSEQSVYPAMLFSPNTPMLCPHFKMQHIYYRQSAMTTLGRAVSSGGLRLDSVPVSCHARHLHRGGATTAQAVSVPESEPCLRVHLADHGGPGQYGQKDLQVEH